MLQTVPIMLQQDPAFHTHGNSTYIMTVRSGDYSTDVYCDGEMRIHVWDSAQAMRNGERHTSVWRYTSDLIEAGIDTDEKLASLFDEGRIDWVHNSWFDLYDTHSGEHLDAVSHELAVAWHTAQTRNDWF
jgi:hypothetical protein